MCPGRAAASTTPVLKVLRGKLIPIHVTHVDFPHNAAIVVIKMADALYLWEAGTSTPTYQPSAPQAYFQLIGQGITPPRACPQVECAAGHFWEWVGMKIGRTAIVMNPSCFPKCEMPSALIEVRIKRR
jgi:hypothetical protein